MSSLFETLGGDEAINTVVGEFYQRVLMDVRINHFFVNIDMDRQRGHMRSFLTVALGGPNKYTGRSMYRSHKKLVDEMGLNDGHFDAVMENLGAALKACGVSDEHIKEAATIAESTRDQVLCRSGE